MSRVIHIAWANLAIALLVLSLKIWAWWLTGSVALYSDALESLVNVAAAVAALVAVLISAQPADANHPYGHHKAEYLAAVMEGVFIVLAAVMILREAAGALMEPRIPEQAMSGILVNGAATVVNMAWATFLIRFGRKRRSPALVADARHIYTDVVTSLGVIGGLGLVLATGWAILDPVLAILVALNILWTGWNLLKESVSGLMDAAPPAEDLERIRSVVSRHAEGALEAHDLRTRHAGRVTFIEFHLVVPGEMTVQDAHDICDNIEHALRAEMHETVITIHVEPEHKAKQSGVLVLP